jgi:hypothetical protein
MEVLRGRDLSEELAAVTISGKPRATSAQNQALVPWPGDNTLGPDSFHELVHLLPDRGLVVLALRGHRSRPFRSMPNLGSCQ